MKKRILISFMLTLVLGITSAYSQQDCTGEFTTFTIGGWGTECNGNNPGCYRDAHFDAAFPDGIVIGCGSNTFTFTSSEAVKNFLPSGGTAAAISGTHTDPATEAGNVLVSQLLGVALAVGFDVNDPNFSQGDTNIGALTIHAGTFAGMSIADFLQLGNQILGGCSSQYTFAEINAAAAAINENYDNGTVDGGYINCVRDIVIDVTVGTNPTVCVPGDGLVTITLDGGTAPYQIQIFKNNVLYTVLNTNTNVAYLNNLGVGNFTVNVTDSLGNTGSATFVLP